MTDKIFMYRHGDKGHQPSCSDVSRHRYERLQPYVAKIRRKQEEAVVSNLSPCTYLGKLPVDL